MVYWHGWLRLVVASVREQADGRPGRVVFSALCVLHVRRRREGLLTEDQASTCGRCHRRWAQRAGKNTDD